MADLICSIAVTVGFALALLFVFALCRISAISDERARRQWEAKNDIQSD